ncbi:MAG: ECF-type sigma factor [Acidobacteriota bacterium]
MSETTETRSVTELIAAHREGDDAAFEQLVGRLYGDLRRIAHFQRARLAAGETLRTTALVHEAFVKIAQQNGARWEGRSHFLAVLGRAMRHVLVDDARRRLSAKGGGGRRPETLDDNLCQDPRQAARIVEVDDALHRLRDLDERLCQVVEYRFFAGLTRDETALALGRSPRTVHRDWLRAKAWLRKLLGDSPAAELPSHG